MSTSNGDMCLKTFELFNLSRSLPSPSILFKKKFANSAFFHNFASFQVNKCPLYGQMETWGLKSTSGATKQRTVLFNLTQEVYQAQPSSSTKNSLSQHFFTILLHSRWTNVHFMGKWRQGLKIELGATKQRTVLFNLTQEVYPAQPSSSRKNSLSQHFFTILLHSRWTNVHFMGKWRQGLKIELGATKQRTLFFNLTQEVYTAQPSSSTKDSLS